MCHSHFQSSSAWRAYTLDTHCECHTGEALAKSFGQTVTSSLLRHWTMIGTNYGSALSPAMQAAGGHWIDGDTGPTEKITAVLGDPPKRFGVTEFENIDKAQAWLKSSGREAIAPQRNKAI